MLDRQNSCLTGSIFAEPHHLSEGLSYGEAPTLLKKII